MISMRSEMCIQTLNFTRFDQVPREGNGISQMVLTVGSPETINWLKSQLFTFAVASNAAYIISMNRLAALGRPKDITKTTKEHQAKTVMDMFITNSERDPVLSQYNFILVDTWNLISI